MIQIHLIQLVFILQSELAASSYFLTPISIDFVLSNLVLIWLGYQV